MEYKALYRQFRPKTFSEILGQNHITTTLKNQVIAGRVGHAYLFTGVRGCGKTSSAKVLARAINCLNPKDGEPCNECEICKAQMDGTLTDVVEMDAASNNGVDDIRAIRDEVNFLPTVAKYRIYIIDEVHMLSPGAFNALLKTLEEPPAHVKFILCTTEPQKLPATILSRCQRFDFKKIPDDKIIENLEHICNECKIKYTGESLKLISELSEGAMRDALSILERCAQDGEDEINEEKVKTLVGIPAVQTVAEIVEKIAEENGQAVLEISEKLINEGKDIVNLLWEMIKYIKDVLLLKTTKKESNIYSKEELQRMQRIAAMQGKNKLMNMIFSLSKLENDLRYTSQKNIVFQVGLLKLCEVSNDENEKIEFKLVEKSTSKTSNTNAVKNVKENVTAKSNASESGVAKSNIRESAEAKTDVTNVGVEAKGPAQDDQNKVSINEENAPQKSDKKNDSMETLAGKSAPFWGKIIDELKSERQPVLATQLSKAQGIVLDDITFGISGLNPVGKNIVGKSENLTEVKRLVSIEMQKDMRIKIIDAPVASTPAAKINAATANKTTIESPLDLDIDINLID